MRKNLPVTQRQYDFPADATLMSTTDTKSRVTYANEAFVEASGFTTEELLGQPQDRKSTRWSAPGRRTGRWTPRTS